MADQTVGIKTTRIYGTINSSVFTSDTLWAHLATINQDLGTSSSPTFTGISTDTISEKTGGAGISFNQNPLPTSDNAITNGSSGKKWSEIYTNLVFGFDGAAMKATSNQSVNASTNTQVAFDTVLYNTNALTTTGSAAKITIKKAGVYMIIGRLMYDTSGVAGTNAYALNIRISGTNVVDNTFPKNTSNFTTALIEYCTPLAVGNYVELWAFQGSVVSVNIMGGSTTRTPYLFVNYLFSES